MTKFKPKNKKNFKLKGQCHIKKEIEGASSLKFYGAWVIYLTQMGICFLEYFLFFKSW